MIRSDLFDPFFRYGICATVTDIRDLVAIPAAEDRDERCSHSGPCTVLLARSITSCIGRDHAFTQGPATLQILHERIQRVLRRNRAALMAAHPVRYGNQLPAILKTPSYDRVLIGFATS